MVCARVSVCVSDVCSRLCVCACVNVCVLLLCVCARVYVCMHLMMCVYMHVIVWQLTQIIVVTYFSETE